MANQTKAQIESIIGQKIKGSLAPVVVDYIVDCINKSFTFREIKWSLQNIGVGIVPGSEPVIFAVIGDSSDWKMVGVETLKFVWGATSTKKPYLSDETQCYFDVIIASAEEAEAMGVPPAPPKDMEAMVSTVGELMTFLGQLPHEAKLEFKGNSLLLKFDGLTLHV